MSEKPTEPDPLRLDRLEIFRSVLALQLRFHVSVFCLGLVGSSPEGPGDDELWLNVFSSEARRDAADFLDRPADERRACQFLIGLGAFGLRRIVFGGGATALA